MYYVKQHMLNMFYNTPCTIFNNAYMYYVEQHAFYYMKQHSIFYFITYVVNYSKKSPLGASSLGSIGSLVSSNSSLGQVNNLVKVV